MPAHHIVFVLFALRINTSFNSKSDSQESAWLSFVAPKNGGVLRKENPIVVLFKTETANALLYLFEEYQIFDLSLQSF
jgi:hypothetical protein